MKRIDPELEGKWNELMEKLSRIFDKKPEDLNAVLFLIGVQELGQGIKNYTKEEKQDLMHIAICKLLSLLGYYELEGHDKDGWPHWRLVKKLPHFNLVEQESLLKMQVIEYFKDY